MASVRWGGLGLLVVAVAASAVVEAGHCPREHASVAAPYPDALIETGMFGVVESVAPGTVPNGLFYYVFGNPLPPGTEFSLTADDPAAVGEVQLDNFDVAISGRCNGPPCEEYRNGPGDEHGVVPEDHSLDGVYAAWMRPGASFTFGCT